MKIEIRSNGNNNLIHELSKGLEIVPRQNEGIIIGQAKYWVVTVDHYINESKIVIRVKRF